MSWSFELVAGPYGGTTEGPVWDGEALLFTHIPAGRILRYSPKTGETTEYFTGTNRTNRPLFRCPRQPLRLPERRPPHRLFRKEPSHHHFLTAPLGRQAAQQPKRLGGRQAGTHLVHRSIQRVCRRPGVGPHVRAPAGSSAVRRLGVETGHSRREPPQRHTDFPGPEDPVRRPERLLAGPAASTPGLPHKQRRLAGARTPLCTPSASIIVESKGAWTA